LEANQLSSVVMNALKLVLRLFIAISVLNGCVPNAVSIIGDQRLRHPIL